MSSNGLVRLALDELLSLRFKHLVSGVDTDLATSTLACGRVTTITGFTEWLAPGFHLLSLGWDWGLQLDAGSIRLRRDGWPRTNILLVSSDGRDLPWERSLSYLSTVIDALPWQEEAVRCALPVSYPASLLPL